MVCISSLVAVVDDDDDHLSGPTFFFFRFSSRREKSIEIAAQVFESIMRYSELD